MIKKTLTYTDYNGNERTETFYFNLNKAEITELEVSHKGGLVSYMEQIIAAEDNSQIINIFKEIIKKSHGVKSEDGRRFIKNEETLANFMQTNAYSELFIELVKDADVAAAFITGLVPEKIQKAINTKEAIKHSSRIDD